MSPKAWPYMPGVPSAGHVTSGGSWHPGAIRTCARCNPPEPPVDPAKDAVDAALPLLSAEPIPFHQLEKRLRKVMGPERIIAALRYLHRQGRAQVTYGRGWHLTEKGNGDGH